MFPATDFNFVVCGIATFAATIGYTCARKLSMSMTENTEARDSIPIPASIPNAAVSDNSSGPSSQAEVEKVLEPLSSSRNTSVQEALRQTGFIEGIPARRPSLKRKIPHDGFDEATAHDLEYPHNLANLYPKKRCRTPSTDGEKEEPSSSSIEKQKQCSQVAEAVQPAIAVQDEDITIPFAHEPEPIAAPIMAPAPPRTPSPVPKVAQVSSPGPNSPVSISVSAPSTPRPSTPASIPSASRGFAAFAGSSSPFATVRMTSQSPFKPTRSIWATETPQGVEAFASTSTAPLTSSNALEGPSAAAATDTSYKDKNHAISAAAPSSAQTVTYVTGEENEDVELELKGVKLYVKRGSKPFSDGMVGHVKLLSNKSTLDERLLFRREPLWKVSMNVRVQPAVRCTFDADEHVVRLVLKEPIEQVNVPQQECATEIVIYALKPGRSCSKQDFKEFAQTLVASAHWKPLTT